LQNYERYNTLALILKTFNARPILQN